MFRSMFCCFKPQTYVSVPQVAESKSDSDSEINTQLDMPPLQDGRLGGAENFQDVPIEKIENRDTLFYRATRPIYFWMNKSSALAVQEVLPEASYAMDSAKNPRQHNK